MAKQQPGLIARIRREFASLGGDLREMLDARWELARAEINEATAKGRTLGILAAGAAGATLIGVSLGATGGAMLLGEKTQLASEWWLLIFAGLLFVLAVLLALAAYRLWRRLALFEDTLAEVKEDLIWLREWRGDKPDGAGD